MCEVAMREVEGDEVLLRKIFKIKYHFNQYKVQTKGDLHLNTSPKYQYYEENSKYRMMLQVKYIYD